MVQKWFKRSAALAPHQREPFVASKRLFWEMLYPRWAQKSNANRLSFCVFVYVCVSMTGLWRRILFTKAFLYFQKRYWSSYYIYGVRFFFVLMDKSDFRERHFSWCAIMRWKTAFKEMKIHLPNPYLKLVYVSTRTIHLRANRIMTICSIHQLKWWMCATLGDDLTHCPLNIGAQLLVLVPEIVAPQTFRALPTLKCSLNGPTFRRSKSPF